MKNYIIIGEILENGEIVKGLTDQGMVFKNPRAFYEKLNEVCYIPELSDTKYTYQDFLNMANGNENIARILFDTVDWQCPETLLDEYLREDELHICTKCNEMYKSYQVEHCPKCNQRKVVNIIKIDDKVKYYYDVNDSEYCVRMYPKHLSKMNWSWESLIFANENETFAVVENEVTKEKTYLVTNGFVKVTDITNEEELSNDEIIKLAMESRIDDAQLYSIDNNNWFALEYYDKDDEFLEDDVFEAIPKTFAELANLLIESHLSYFEK